MTNHQETSPQIHVGVIDDHDLILIAMDETLRADGYTPMLAKTYEEAQQKIAEHKVAQQADLQAAVIDTNIHGSSGQEVMELVKQEFPEALIISHTSEDKGLEGAVFIRKDVTSGSAILDAIAKHLAGRAEQ